MARGRWVTPNEPGDVIVSRCISVPANLLPALNGALELLAQSYNWEQAGDMTADDAAAAFRDVVDAYYESEGCDMTVPQDRAFVFWPETKQSAGNAIAFQQSLSQEYDGYFRQETPAINDISEFTLVLSEGTYDLSICAVKDNASGIQHWLVDDVEDAQTIDLYASSQSLNFKSTISVVVVGSGLHTFKCKMSSKNASSSNYRNGMTYVKLLRTGD